MTLPGYEFAKENGYSLHSHAANRKRASYVKQYKNDFLHLDIDKEMQECSLVRIIGIAECKIGPFSLPNRNFKVFENQLMRIVETQ